MNGHRNLKERYYLTRELVTWRKRRDELLKAIPLAAKIPFFRQNTKATRDFFFDKAEMISFALEHITDALSEAGGGFND